MSEAPARDLSARCKVCDAEFARKNRKGTYCSVRCRKKASQQRQHDPGALLNQISVEFKKKIEIFSNKEELYTEMDKLVMEWAGQLRALVGKGQINVPNDLESYRDDSAL